MRRKKKNHSRRRLIAKKTRRKSLKFARGGGFKCRHNQAAKLERSLNV